MMQNKRFTALLPALLAALCLAACSRDPSVFSSSSPSSGGPTAVSAVDPAGESQAQSEPEEDPLLSESIAKQLMGGAYYIDGTSVIEIEGFRLENAVTIAVDKGNSAVKTTSEMSGALTTMRVVTLDGTTWLVNDTSKTCTKVDPAEMSGGFDTDFSYLSFEERGEGSFDGETLRYEQYDQQGDTVRFFFDEEGRLAGMTRTLEDEQLAEMILKIKAISGNIPAKTIALPEGYSILQ